LVKIWCHVEGITPMPNCARRKRASKREASYPRLRISPTKAGTSDTVPYFGETHWVSSDLLLEYRKFEVLKMRHTQGTANPSTLQANTSPQQSKAVTYGSAGQPAGATSQPRTGIRVNASALRAQRAYAQSETRAPEAPKMPDVSVAPIPPARTEPQQK
jgi:hypothetical protein